MRNCYPVERLVNGEIPVQEIGHWRWVEGDIEVWVDGQWWEYSTGPYVQADHDYLVSHGVPEGGYEVEIVSCESLGVEAGECLYCSRPIVPGTEYCSTSCYGLDRGRVDSQVAHHTGYDDLRPVTGRCSWCQSDRCHCHVGLE